MNAGFIPLAISMIGLAYAALMLKNRQRRDNAVFGVLVLVDAGMTAWRGLNVLTGGSIVAPGVLVPCTIGTIALALMSFEFVYAFPRRAPMPWSARLALLAWGCVAIALALVNVGGPWKHNTAIELGFFLPATILIFLLIVRAYRKTQQTDARVVLSMLAFRWLFGFFAYFIAPVLGIFAQAVWAETTIGSIIAFVVIGTAVLRTELFSSRSAISEVITIASLGVLVMLGAGGSVAAARTWVPEGQLQDLALFGATLVPLALAAIGVTLYPRVERRVLAGLDERRARRLNVQGDPLPADAASAIAEASSRISTFGDGSRVRWVPAAQLEAETAELLRSEGVVRKDQDVGAPCCLAVPAFGAEGAIVGAFYIDGGTLDRDTYLVARDLAQRVALAVERHQAVSELDDARRLAALGQFAAAIAHDIRTPLTSISLNVQILRRKLQLSDDDREHLDIALEELARLDKSVAEILDFAKPVKLASEEIDVDELIEDAAKGLSPVLSERGVSLATESGSELTIHGDAQRLRQVLANLVGNAADASKPGAKVVLRAVPANDGQVAIEVEDHGRGIGADDLPQIGRAHV